MLKLKLTFYLPALQLALAIGLLAWGHNVREPRRLESPYVPTPTAICIGLNAPALVTWPLISRLPATLFDHPPRSTFAFGTDEIIFLTAVVAAWYRAARWLGALRNTKQDGGKQVRIAGHLAAAAVGIVLLAHAAILIRSPGRLNNRLGTLAEGILSLAWAIILFSAALQSFVKRAAS